MSPLTRRPARLRRALCAASGLILGAALASAPMASQSASDARLPVGRSNAVTPGAWAVAGGGTWVSGNRIVRQTANTEVDPKKYVLAGLTNSGDQDIVARVRVDSFPSASSRVGVSLRTDLSTGHGYNFVVIAGNQVGFLADQLAWGQVCAYPWSYGRWYWMKLAIGGGTLTGKIWSDGQAESEATVCTQSGWSYFAGGAPGLNGGSFGETASFDNVTVGSFFDDFNVNAPPVPPQPPAGFLSTSQFVNEVQINATALGFDLGRFIDIMQTTAQTLVCANNPSVCQNYVPGTFAVVPSPFYSSGTWMRDSTWTLGALNDVDHLAALTSKFAAAGDGSTGRIATLIHNGGGPWYGAGGQGNPLPDDDSNLMFAIAARLGWQTVVSQSYLNNVYSWIRSHAAGDGSYPATSHAWLDSFYPLGTGGAGSVTVSANMQGLYAVALRSLTDLGVAVPQSEIDAANAQYAGLTIDGRLRAYQNADIVDVSSLMGEALSLFIWNEPILSDAVVQNTIASFAEVYDQGGQFVGYKVLSYANRSFLSPGMFPVENDGAGLGGGDYQNGGSWMLYEVMALYAGARHDILSMRDTYIDRLVKRMVSELRAGVGTTPANKSHEFLCTAPGNPGDPCQPTGSAAPERADYGWNAFVVRLLSDESPADGTACGHVPAGDTSGSACPILTASPVSLRFAATKAGATGGLVAATPPQTVTVLFPGAPGGWTATVDRTWIQLTGPSGGGNGQFGVGIVNPVNVIGSATSLSGTVTITPADASLTGVTIPVTLVVDQTGAATAAPFGQVDTPVQNATGVVGAIGVTGWVLDDIGVTGVQIYRTCLAFENQTNCQAVVGHSVVYIGDAAFVAGARPDVEAAFPGYPYGYRAGWGYLLLTNMLPDVTNSQPYGGQGALTLYAFATDVEGHRTLLGRSQVDHTPTAITMANATIAKPFGAIDTPGQGETVSGLLPNFGWALTPDSDTIAGNGDIEIPTNGSTMVVFIDGVATAPVTYNQCRGNVGNPVPAGVYCNDDVANIFGNATPQPTLTTRTANPTKHRNLDMARAAIGSYDIDTTALTNGLHSIAWSVTDSASRVEGIGSRNFIVLNGSSDPMSIDALLDAPARAIGSASDMSWRPLAAGAVWGRAGFDLRAAWETVKPDSAGTRHVRMPELGRVELSLGPVSQSVEKADPTSGYLIVDGTLRPLPVGSQLTDGHFTWVPPVGYLGAYELVFLNGIEQVPVTVTIHATSEWARIEAYIDEPRANTTVSGAFAVTGWAADPTAWSGTGIGAVHVWAHRRDADVPPIFLGAADLNGWRPDVGVAVGAQFERAGWALTAPTLPSGEYDVVACFRSNRTGGFEDSRTARVTVR